MKHQKLETSPEISKRMSNVSLKEGKAETKLAKALWHAGVRYRKNYRELPGSPDIAITKSRIAIFIDGEFWHGYDWDRRKGKLKSNREYWIEKIEENIARDKRNDRLLVNMGWTPIHLWEKEVKEDIEGCMKKILDEIRLNAGRDADIPLDGVKGVCDLYDKEDPKSIETYAKKLIGNTFSDVGTWNLPSVIQEEKGAYSARARKGGLGNFIEEQFFCYKANNDSEPDFPEAGVELKVTPYEKRKNGKLSAGERLVITMINYNQAVDPDFINTSLWKKCKLILLIYYLRDRRIRSNMDFRIDYVKLFTPPEKDLEIILQDYKIIIDKIATGKANELSEADTMYLGACTKGANAEKSIVEQKYYAPGTTAKSRAFCFKASYMTSVLNDYIAHHEETYEPIVKNPDQLKGKTFEEYITAKIERHVGKTDEELCHQFDREYNNNKAQWSDLAFRMLGIKSNRAEEFAKAQIVVKAIRIEENGAMRESSPLPALSFKELLEEEWEDSTLFRYFDETKFFFVVYRKQEDRYVLKGCQLWNMPNKDLEEVVYDGWKKTRDIINKGIIFEKTQQKSGIVVKNNLPKKKDNPIIHIRPHTQKTYYVLADGKVFGKGKLSDSDELPDGRRMTKQSFWLNNTYIMSQLRRSLKE
jgi:DNA mismatch repair protein MutH